MNDSEPELPETVELPTRAVHIGRDAEGCDHYVIPGQSVIVVRHAVGGDQHVITQQLRTARCPSGSSTRTTPTAGPSASTTIATSPSGCSAAPLVSTGVSA